MRCLVARTYSMQRLKYVLTPVAGDSYMDSYIVVLRIVCELQIPRLQCGGVG